MIASKFRVQRWIYNLQAWVGLAFERRGADGCNVTIILVTCKNSPADQKDIHVQPPLALLPLLTAFNKNTRAFSDPRIDVTPSPQDPMISSPKACARQSQASKRISTSSCGKIAHTVQRSKQFQRHGQERSALGLYIKLLRPRPSPIRRLPNDVLSEIFVEALYPPSLGDVAIDDDETIAPIRQMRLRVCRRWRITSISEPRR